MLTSKRMKSGRIRGPYRPACDICSRRRVKCDGDPGTVCPRCQNSGRGTLCSWDGYHARQKRCSELLVVDIRKHVDSEAFRRLLLEYNGYTNLLESELENYIRSFSLKDVTDFRAHRPRDPEDLMGLSFRLEDFHLDEADSFLVESEEIDCPTNIHLWPDKLALVHYGPCSPFRFRSDPLPVPSRFPAISENPEATYVLQVGGDETCSPHFDWARYLPSAVPLDRRSHDKALDLFFKFCTPFGLRLVPGLFLKDMHQALSVPRSQGPPKTSHYSPMLHNVLVASAFAFLDDPRLQDVGNRQHFVDAAKDFMETECQKPTIAVVQALSLLGNFYGSQGEQGLGFIAFGQSVRVAQALGLHLDCSELVRRSLMDKSDQTDRNWVTWSIFIIDVCWSLYVGREFAVVVPPDDFPLPYIDTALDEMPVVYGRLPPQPNHLTKTFQANAELFIIGRDILEVNNALSKAKARSSIIFDRVGDIGVKLQTWYSSLPPELQLPAAKSRSMVLTPHKLTLHLCYWWLVILLHRPFFHHGASVKGGRQIDHVKICRRASDRIMEILKTWQEYFGVRFCAVSMIQIAFSAGSVYLLLAMRACSGMRIAKKELNHAVEQQHLVTHYLQEISRSWPAANKVADILKNLVQQKLKPRLSPISVANKTTEGDEGDDCSMLAHSPSLVRIPGEGMRRRSSGSKPRSPINRRPRSSSRISAQDSDPAFINQPPVSPNSPHLFKPVSALSAPITNSPISNEPEGLNVDHDSNATYPSLSPEVMNDTFFHNMLPDHVQQRFSIPPNQLINRDISSHSHQACVGQTNVHVSTSWSPPLTGFVGMPEGQPMTELPFWNQISTEDGQAETPAFETLLDEYLRGSNDPSTITQPEPAHAGNIEEMEVSVDEGDYWFGRFEGFAL